MIRDTWLLLTLRWQVGWNGFRNHSIGYRLIVALGGLAIAVLTIGFCGGIGYGAGALLQRYPNVQLDSLLPGAILTAVAGLLLLTSFGSALGSLFLSSDLDLLMTAPVDRRAVFISKVLDGLGVSYAILAVTAVPALTTYGLALHYGPLYYILALLALAGTPLLPEGLGALLVMLVARFAPARRVREVLGLFGALVGLSCSLLGQTSRLWMRDLAGLSTDLQALQRQVEAVAGLPIPSLVAGRGLTAAGRGDLAGAVAGLGGFALLTFGFFALCVWLADSLYASGWVRMQSSGTARRSPQRAARAAARGGWLGRAPVDLALALKDWRVIPRDLRNFAQVLGSLVLLPVIYFNLLGGGGRSSFNAVRAAGDWTHGQLDPTGIIIAIGILSSASFLFLNLTATAISMEGKSWWLIKAAPISGLELVRGKFLAAWIPFVILTTGLLIGAAIWKGFSPLGLLYGWFGIELLGAGILATSLGFGLRWPQLTWSNPRQMRSGWAAFCSFLAEAFVGVLGGGFLCLPVLAQVVLPGLLLPAWIAGILGATAVTAGAAWAALALGLAHLPHIGEA
ncbi:MAG TPA: hypothetical protein VKY74_02350 [Chloroflexia bacterium]|nr:hypothetical protein [Chloroflexia bacterium]